MGDVAQNIINAGETGLWDRAIVQIQDLLESDPTDQTALERLGMIYRQSGKLVEASEVYARLATLNKSNIYANAVSQLCGGTVQPNTQFPTDISPARFIRKTSFLSLQNREKLMALFAEMQPEMGELSVTHKGHGAEIKDEINRSMRYQFGRYCKTELELLVHSEVIARFSEFCEMLNIDYFEPGDVSLRLDYTPHGGFGKMHQDVGLDARLSYLYYFHTLPKKFSGGDLLFFDQNIDKNHPIVNQFVRITCEDNMLIVFPPKYFHQVTRVTALSPPMAPYDSRLSVCGFIHASNQWT